MEDVPALRFARCARVLVVAAQAAGLRVPAFRSPPGRTDAQRTIRRRPGGDVVAVRLRDRSAAEVEADMIEGVIAANRLTGPAAEQVRVTLAAALADAGRLTSTRARVAERQTQAA